MAVKPLYLKLLSSLFFAVLSANSFGQNLQWAKQIGGSGWDEGASIKTDQNNNVYVVGLFIGTVDFDPGIGVFNLSSVGERDAFIAKFDSAGSLIWAKQYGDNASINEDSALEIDALNNLYITNSFLGTVDFDPGPGSFNLTSQGSDIDIFVQKLDANGNFIWAKQIGGPFVPLYPTPAHSNALAVDAIGNIFLTGYFDGTIDFDPHPTATFNLTSQFNASDIFVCKLDTDGNFVWAKQFTGTLSGGGVGYAIAVDATGNVYSTGTIGAAVDFDPGPATFHLTTSVPRQTEIYISKLDASGNFVWAKAMGAGGGHTIAIDQNSNVYASGWYPSGFTPVINKLDSAGNLLWAKQLGGIDGKSITVDVNGNVYITGQCFVGTNDFDPGLGVFNLTSGNSDAFISKLDASGNFVWAGLLTGTEQVWINSIAIDKNDNILTTGFFNGAADFDSAGPIYNLTSPVIGYDIFITKLSQNTTLGGEQFSFEQNFKIYPNPTEGTLIVESNSALDQRNMVLRNMLGQVVHANFRTTHNKVEIQINEASGIYLLEIFDEKNQKAVLKIIKK